MLALRARRRGALADALTELQSIRARLDAAIGVVERELLRSARDV